MSISIIAVNWYYSWVLLAQFGRCWEIWLTFSGNKYMKGKIISQIWANHRQVIWFRVIVAAHITEGIPVIWISSSFSSVKCGGYYQEALVLCVHYSATLCESSESYETQLHIREKNYILQCLFDSWANPVSTLRRAPLALLVKTVTFFSRLD